MKNILILLAVLLASFSHARDKKEDIKYQGLLWEITGNGLEKTSYLYGTMHVSRKIAFNLDDVLAPQAWRPENVIEWGQSEEYRIIFLYFLTMFTFAFQM